VKITEAQESRTDGPVRFAMHGLPGIGKSTLVAHFPKVVFLSHEEQNVPRDLPFKVKTLTGFRDWTDVLDTVDSLTNDPHDFITVAIDTVDWLEPLIHRYVCERDSGRKTEMNPASAKLESIEDYGFQKGYIVAEEEFRRLVWRLDILQARRGMHVAMLAHSHVKNFKNPGGADYDRWVMKVHPRIAQVVVEWSETMLFGFFEAFVSKEPEEKKKLGARAKGSSTGRRLLGTQWNAQYDAKNRCRLPAEMELADPRALIPFVLGEHLYPQQEDGPGVASDSRPVESSSTATPSPRRRPPAPEPVDVPPADIPWQGSSAHPGERRPAYDSRAEHAEAVRGAPETMATRHPQHPTGIPADSWARRGEEAQDIVARDHERARAPASTRDANTDAQTWTEPTPPPASGAPARDRRDDPREGVRSDERDRVLLRLTETLTAARALGAPYYEKVSEWARDAAGDLVKIGKLIEKIKADIAAVSQPTSAATR
jgi:hypothetical protein